MKKKLKIAYIVNVFPVLSESFLINQITDLIDKGHEVHIFSSGKANPPYHRKVEDYNLVSSTIYPPVLSANPLKKGFILAGFILSNLKLSHKVIRFLKNKTRYTNWFILYWIHELRNNKYDVIHAHFSNNALMICDLIKFKLIPSIPLLTTFHGFDVKLLDPLSKEVSLLMKFSTLFTVNSMYTKEEVTKLGIPENRIVKLPVGVDTSLFSPSCFRRRVVFQILFIGRLVEFKAPELVIHICVELRKRGIDFFCDIIGTGPLYNKLEKMIQDYKMQDYISLTGPLVQEQIIEYMHHAQVFLLPGITDEKGRAENQGLVIQEAQAMNLPVIVSDAGGMQEGMQERVTGYVIPEKDIRGFADKLEFLFANRELCKKMGEAGRKYVMAYFDSKIVGKQLVSVYHEMMSNE